MICDWYLNTHTNKKDFHPGRFPNLLGLTSPNIGLLQVFLSIAIPFSNPITLISNSTTSFHYLTGLSLPYTPATSIINTTNFYILNFFNNAAFSITRLYTHPFWNLWAAYSYPQYNTTHHPKHLLLCKNKVIGYFQTHTQTFRPISRNTSNTALVQSTLLFQPQYSSTQPTPHFHGTPQSCRHSAKCQLLFLYILHHYSIHPQFFELINSLDTIPFSSEFSVLILPPRIHILHTNTLTLLKFPLSPEHLLCNHLADLVHFVNSLLHPIRIPRMNTSHCPSLLLHFLWLSSMHWRDVFVRILR